ncbi:2-(1,2-epoxy-1,2-dihydrophenyl)acetyl-CoA isomerase [Paenibacillus sp. yr247]|uniref:enoyl-CoA hydratase/isomerase family protein n=1 Tax=Paenibacillus sp. yr247 TaxID=1761880 RepID=UPI00088A8CAD|nr:enoyl-CoA hydratase-related protein [Paenibacillus sp. yr247]SDP24955.1 2-(1,2-epoxy-1,2-dihydrophenyl)acetyl-CoA isomerase [Paenibacillus sp. yr247]
MFDTVKYSIENHVATISMNIPKTINAFNFEMHRDLYAALSAANENPDVRCIVLTGEGRGFSTGADLTSINFQERMDYGDILSQTYNKLLRYMMEIRKPIIAAIHGVAAGAGLSIALACDFRLATEEAKLTVAFIKIGLIPDAGAHFFLPRIVGLAKALELSALGSILNGTEAESIGLINKAIPADHFHEEVRLFAQQLVQKPLLAFGKMKEIMYKSLDNDLNTVLGWEEEGQRLMGASNDHKEGVTAFLEKRAPVFRDQ